VFSRAQLSCRRTPTLEILRVSTRLGQGSFGWTGLQSLIALTRLQRPVDTGGDGEHNSVSIITMSSGNDTELFTVPLSTHAATSTLAPGPEPS
jgi:hypothetical protein